MARRAFFILGGYFCYGGLGDRVEDRAATPADFRLAFVLLSTFGTILHNAPRKVGLRRSGPVEEPISTATTGCGIPPIMADLSEVERCGRGG
jgi:hypothetical protein